MESHVVGRTSNHGDGCGEKSLMISGLDQAVEVPSLCHRLWSSEQKEGVDRFRDIFRHQLCVAFKRIIDDEFIHIFLTLH